MAKRNKSLEARVENLEKGSLNHEVRHGELQSALESALTRIAELTGEISDLKDKVNGVAELSARIDELEARLAKPLVKRLADEYEVLETRIDKLSRELDGRDKKINRLTSERNGYKQHVDDLEEEARRLGEQIESLETSLKATEQQLREREGEVGVLTDKAARLEKDLNQQRITTWQHIIGGDTPLLDLLETLKSELEGPEELSNLVASTIQGIRRRAQGDLGMMIEQFPPEDRIELPNQEPAQYLESYDWGEHERPFDAAEGVVEKVVFEVSRKGWRTQDGTILRRARIVPLPVIEANDEHVEEEVEAPITSDVQASDEQSAEVSE